MQKNLASIIPLKLRTSLKISCLLEFCLILWQSTLGFKLLKTNSYFLIILWHFFSQVSTSYNNPCYILLLSYYSTDSSNKTNDISTGNPDRGALQVPWRLDIPAFIRIYQSGMTVLPLSLIHLLFEIMEEVTWLNS